MGAPKGLGDGWRLAACEVKAEEAGEPKAGVRADEAAPKGLGLLKGLGLFVEAPAKADGAGAPKSDAVGTMVAGTGAPNGLAVPRDETPKGLLAGAVILEL
jgi:hypothetical protein